MHSITLNQNWKIVRVTLDPPQKGPSRKCKKPILYSMLLQKRKADNTTHDTPSKKQQNTPNLNRGRQSLEPGRVRQTQQSRQFPP
jgi:hypothetical protein